MNKIHFMLILIVGVVHSQTFAVVKEQNQIRDKQLRALQQQKLIRGGVFAGGLVTNPFFKHFCEYVRSQQQAATEKQEPQQGRWGAHKKLIDNMTHPFLKHFCEYVRAQQQTERENRERQQKLIRGGVFAGGFMTHPFLKHFCEYVRIQQQTEQEPREQQQKLIRGGVFAGGFMTHPFFKHVCPESHDHPVGDENTEADATTDSN